MDISVNLGVELGSKEMSYFTQMKRLWSLYELLTSFVLMTETWMHFEEHGTKPNQEAFLCNPMHVYSGVSPVCMNLFPCNTTRGGPIKQSMIEILVPSRSSKANR